MGELFSVGAQLLAVDYERGTSDVTPRQAHVAQEHVYAARGAYHNRLRGSNFEDKVAASQPVRKSAVRRSDQTGFACRGFR